MNVIDRYLLAVKVFLPRATQRDITRELSEDIRSRIEDREAGLGRPLTAAEQDSLVKELGHPALLAGRYGPRRHLIGAEMFPFYWLVLRLALGIGVAVHVAVTLAMLASGKTDQAIRQAFVALPLVAFVQFGIITIVFAMLDSYGVVSRCNRRFTPHTLPASARRARQPLVQLTFVALFAGWWFAALRAPFLIFGPGAAVVRFAPIWQTLYVPMLLLALADIAVQILDLVRPQPVRIRSLARITLYGFDLVVLFFLARAGEWLVITDTARGVAGLQRVLEVLNECFLWGFPFVGIAIVARMFPELRAMRHAASQTLRYMV